VIINKCTEYGTNMTPTYTPYISVKYTAVLNVNYTVDNNKQSECIISV
jgi:hypothetical protein